MKNIQNMNALVIVTSQIFVISLSAPINASGNAQAQLITQVPYSAQEKQSRQTIQPFNASQALPQSNEIIVPETPPTSTIARKKRPNYSPDLLDSLSSSQASVPPTPGDKRTWSQIEEEWRNRVPDENTPPTPSPKSSLFNAIKDGDSKEVAALIKRKALSPNVRNNQYSETALHWAVQYGRKNVVDCLLGRQANVNAVDSSGKTPLMTACMYQQTEIAKVLIGHNAQVNAQDKEKWTALHFAALRGDEALVKLLIRKKADTSLTDNGGKTALHIAQEHQRDAIITLLTQKQAAKK